MTPQERDEKITVLRKLRDEAIMLGDRATAYEVGYKLAADYALPVIDDLVRELEEGRPSDGSPHVIVKRIAWDGWKAVVVGCPLIQSVKHTAVEAVEDVLSQLNLANGGE